MTLAQFQQRVRALLADKKGGLVNLIAASPTLLGQYHEALEILIAMSMKDNEMGRMLTEALSAIERALSEEGK